MALVNKCYVPLKSNDHFCIWSETKKTWVVIEYKVKFTGDLNWIMRYWIGGVPVSGTYWCVALAFWESGDIYVLDLSLIGELLIAARNKAKSASEMGSIEYNMRMGTDGELQLTNHTHITRWRTKLTITYNETGPHQNKEKACKRIAREQRHDIINMDSNLNGNDVEWSNHLHAKMRILAHIYFCGLFNYYVFACEWCPDFVIKMFKLLEIGWIDEQLKRWRQENKGPKPKKYWEMKINGELVFDLAKNGMWLFAAFCIVCFEKDKKKDSWVLTLNACVWFQVAYRFFYAFQIMSIFQFDFKTEEEIDELTIKLDDMLTVNILDIIYFLPCLVCTSFVRIFWVFSDLFL